MVLNKVCWDIKYDNWIIGNWFDVIFTNNNIKSTKNWWNGVAWKTLVTFKSNNYIFYWDNYFAFYHICVYNLKQILWCDDTDYCSFIFALFCLSKLAFVTWGFSKKKWLKLASVLQHSKLISAIHRYVAKQERTIDLYWAKYW